MSVAFAVGREGEHLQNIADQFSEKQLGIHLQSRKFSAVWFPFPLCVQIWLLSYYKILSLCPLWCCLRSFF